MSKAVPAKVQYAPGLDRVKVKEVLWRNWAFERVKESLIWVLSEGVGWNQGMQVALPHLAPLPLRSALHLLRPRNLQRRANVIFCP